MRFLSMSRARRGSPPPYWLTTKRGAAYFVLVYIFLHLFSKSLSFTHGRACHFGNGRILSLWCLSACSSGRVLAVRCLVQRQLFFVLF